MTCRFCHTSKALILKEWSANSQDENRGEYGAMNSPRDLPLQLNRGHIEHTAPIVWSVTTDTAHEGTPGHFLQHWRIKQVWLSKYVSFYRQRMRRPTTRRFGWRYFCSTLTIGYVRVVWVFVETLDSFPILGYWLSIKFSLLTLSTKSILSKAPLHQFKQNARSYCRFASILYHSAWLTP